MELSPAQTTTLRNAVLAEPSLAAARNTGDDGAIAAWLNATLPDFWVYRTSVAITEVGDAINADELVGLTALNLQRLQAITGDLSGGEINPSNDDRRGAFDKIFAASGGTITRPALAVLWRRLARRGERLLAVGTGTVASVAKLTFEGSVTPDQASMLR